MRCLLLCLPWLRCLWCLLALRLCSSFFIAPFSSCVFMNLQRQEDYGSMTHLRREFERRKTAWHMCAGGWSWRTLGTVCNSINWGPYVTLYLSSMPDAQALCLHMIKLQAHLDSSFSLTFTLVLHALLMAHACTPMSCPVQLLHTYICASSLRYMA